MHIETLKQILKNRVKVKKDFRDVFKLFHVII